MRARTLASSAPATWRRPLVAHVVVGLALAVAAGCAAGDRGGVSAGSPARPPAGTAMPATIAPTRLDERLRELGLDPRALPPMKALEPRALRGVMNLFTKALGVRCSHCHKPDFRAPTREKALTVRMWDDFTRGFALEAGGAIFCDSCHQGRARFLDRSDPEALGAWMRAHFVDGVRRTDRKAHGCESCHGTPFEGDIFTKLWKN